MPVRDSASRIATCKGNAASLRLVHSSLPTTSALLYCTWSVGYTSKCSVLVQLQVPSATICMSRCLWSVSPVRLCALSSMSLPDPPAVYHPVPVSPVELLLLPIPPLLLLLLLLRLLLSSPWIFLSPAGLVLSRLLLRPMCFDGSSVLLRISVNQSIPDLNSS
jgi:hypothetical protein